VFGGGNRDAFVAKVNATGTALIYSTFIGGNGTDADWGYGIAVDASRNAYVIGYTPGPFPTTAGAYQTGHGGGRSDAYVVKLDPTGSTLIYSTLLGGSGDDFGASITVDERGFAYVTGTTTGHFPTTANALQSSYSGDLEDCFVAVLNATGSALVYSTYLGTSGDDYPFGIALDRGGNLYVSGEVGGGGLPTTPGAYQTAYGGGDYDAFVVKFLADAGLRNYQGLWWKFPASSEAGWGINFAHQGDIIFATWFTYDANGKPLWFIVLANKIGPGLYKGPVSTVTGPSFDSVPFDPTTVVETIVGDATITFLDGNNAGFTYNVFVGGIQTVQSKSITRQVFTAPGTVCH
jgi:hypothetical protein